MRRLVIVDSEISMRGASLRAHLAEYMVASWQYENRSQPRERLTMEEFARQ